MTAAKRKKTNPYGLPTTLAQSLARLIIVKDEIKAAGGFTYVDSPATTILHRTDQSLANLKTTDWRTPEFAAVREMPVKINNADKARILLLAIKASERIAEQYAGSFDIKPDDGPKFIEAANALVRVCQHAQNLPPELQNISGFLRQEAIKSLTGLSIPMNNSADLKTLGQICLQFATESFRNDSAVPVLTGDEARIMEFLASTEISRPEQAPETTPSMIAPVIRTEELNPDPQPAEVGDPEKAYRADIDKKYSHVPGYESSQDPRIAFVQRFPAKSASTEITRLKPAPETAPPAAWLMIMNKLPEGFVVSRRQGASAKTPALHQAQRRLLEHST